MEIFKSIYGYYNKQENFPEAMALVDWLNMAQKKVSYTLTSLPKTYFGIVLIDRTGTEDESR